MFTPRILAVAALLAPTLTASDFTTPSGIQSESIPGAPVAGVLNDGTLLYGTGSFGADQLSVRGEDGTLQLFAQGFGSIAGIAESSLSGRLIVGDSFGAFALWELVDFNNDGDVLDAGEMFPFAVQPPNFSSGFAPLPFSLAFRPGTDELFMTGSTPFGVDPLQGGLVRIVEDSAEILLDDLGFAAGMAFDGDELYIADLAADFASGRVVRLDTSAEGTSATVFADGLSGASGLVRASDGNFYISGTSDVASGDFSGCVTQLAPDGDNDGLSDLVTPCVIDGFSFAGGLVLVEGESGFVPGATGDGRLFVGDFTFGGARQFRSAPFASTASEGEVAQNSLVRFTVGGGPGAAGFLALSLDTTGVTIGGIGDLGLGFAGLSLITGMKTLDGAGEADFNILFRELPSIVGQDVAVQGYTLEGGDFGIGNSLSFTFGG